MRCAIVMPSSTARPSTWWKAGMCVASSSSVRNTRPMRGDVDRHAALEQRAGLHRRGVRAQHEAALGRVDVEGVLHLARRVVGVEVQGVEVEPLRLDLGTLGDLPAHARRTGRRCAGDISSIGWRRPSGRRPVGSGDVDGLLGEDPLVALGLELGLAGGERLRRPGRGPGRRACRPRPSRSGAARRSRGWRGRAALRSPWCALRAALSSSSVVGRGGGRERRGDGVVDGLRVERRDLDGVVAGVGS